MIYDYCTLFSQFKMYSLEGDGIPIRIGYTIGIDISDPNQSDIRNLLCVVDGHVPQGHKVKDYLNHNQIII